MRASGLSLCLACIVALLVLSPRPASAQPSALGAGGVTTGTYEEVGYRYRGHYGYRPGYRRYGYYRPYHRPYYGYYGYRRPYYGYGYGYGGWPLDNQGKLLSDIITYTRELIPAHAAQRLHFMPARVDGFHT